MENYKLGLFITLAVVFGISAASLTFYYSPPINDFDAFISAMKKCETGEKYISEEDAATWRYTISRVEGTNCVVEVTLLQPKQGSIDMEKLAGDSMECTFQRGVATYPERNLDACHGLLKEELQTIVIDKLQTYVIENLRNIDQGLSESQ